MHVEKRNISNSYFFSRDQLVKKKVASIAEKIKQATNLIWRHFTSLKADISEPIDPTKN